MLPLGSIFFSVLVDPFKTWFPLRRNILYHSKVDFDNSEDVCSFIAYCVTEFKTVFRSLIFWQFLFLP